MFTDLVLSGTLQVPWERKELFAQVKTDREIRDTIFKQVQLIKTLGTVMGRVLGLKPAAVMFVVGDCLESMEVKSSCMKLVSIKI